MTEAQESTETGPDSTAPAKPWQHLRSPAFFLATGAGVGLIPFAPGTFGSLWGIPIAIAFSFLPNAIWHLAALVIINLIGIPICTKGAALLGRKDPGAVVWDEIATVPIAFFLIPQSEMTWPVLLIGFGLHRLFDISKTPPANHLEGLKDGLGIMADDWAAGVWACLAMHLLRWLGVLAMF